MNDRLSIGECARRAGLSVSALRFYGDRGLLPPASVDPDTGYRAYGEHEVAVAVTIRDLQRLGMPLAGVAAYLGPAPGAARRPPGGAGAPAPRRWRADLPGRGDLTVGVEGPDVVVRGDGLERRAAARPAGRAHADP